MSFTDQQKADYVAGKAVKLENGTDKQGFHATMYIKFNPEKGRQMCIRDRVSSVWFASTKIGISSKSVTRSLLNVCMG